MSDTTDLDGTGYLQRGRHPVNVGHLVMGMAFLGLLVVWAIVQADVIDNEDIRWLLPVPWVLAGAAGLVASVLAGRRQARPQHQVTGRVPPAVSDPVEADPFVADPADDPVVGRTDGPADDERLS